MRAPSGPLGERPDRLGLRVLEHVVAEADDQPVARSEALGHPDDLRDTAGLRLHLVREIELEQGPAAVPMLDPAVAEEVDEVARVLLAGDEHDLANARELEQLERSSRPSASGRPAAGACS